MSSIVCTNIINTYVYPRTYLRFDKASALAYKYTSEPTVSCVGATKYLALNDSSVVHEYQYCSWDVETSHTYIFGGALPPLWKVGGALVPLAPLPLPLKYHVTCVAHTRRDIFHAMWNVVHANLCCGTTQKHACKNEVINEWYCTYNTCRHANACSGLPHDAVSICLVVM